MNSEEAFQAQPDILPISVYNKPKSYLSILIIDRKDTEEILNQYKDNYFYILRHKKEDSFKTLDTLCVISYISNINNELTHHILTESNYIQFINYIESIGYRKLII